MSKEKSEMDYKYFVNELVVKVLDLLKSECKEFEKDMPFVTRTAVLFRVCNIIALSTNRNLEASFFKTREKFDNLMQEIKNDPTP